MQGFMHFYCEKLYLWTETVTRGGLRPHRHIDWVPTDVGPSLLLVRRCGTLYRNNCVILFTPPPSLVFTEDISFLRVLACTAH